jgi:hypothetical protein
MPLFDCVEQRFVLCAQHVLQLGGESPLQTLTGGTVS